jgi:pimeloyl-ACP methyl ester carboxylesterase
LRKPLLVIFGNRDKIVDPGSAKQFRRVRKADVILLPGTGHSAMVEKPLQTAALIARFEK